MKVLNIDEKRLEPEDYVCQFTGILKIKKNSINLFINEYKNLKKNLQNNISSSEFINLNLKKIFYKMIPIEFNWIEVDNIENLSIAESKF